MKIKWWHAVAVAGVVWLGRMLWSTGYEQGMRDGLANLYLQIDKFQEGGLSLK